MNEYRTPQELAAQDAHTERIQAVLDRAVTDGASLYAAMVLDEPPAVVERWVDAFWDQLRADLSDARPDDGGLIQEDRLAAIAILLDEQIREQANRILAPITEDMP